MTYPSPITCLRELALAAGGGLLVTAMPGVLAFKSAFKGGSSVAI
jgi:hypothetical protein